MGPFLLTLWSEPGMEPATDHSQGEQSATRQLKYIFHVYLKKLQLLPKAQSLN